MRSRSLATALLCGCLAACPALAVDQKVPANADPTMNADGGKLPAGDYTGKLVSTPGTDGSFTVAAEQENPKLAKDAGHTSEQMAKDQEHIEKLQLELARTKSVQTALKLNAEINEANQKLQADAAKDQAKENADAKTKTYKNVDFHAADEVKVRLKTLPPRTDDNGKPKPYTQDEQTAAKGTDKNLPGYESSLDALKVGALVKVTLVVPKPVKKDADTDKDSDTTSDPKAKPPNVVTVILILPDDTGKDAKPKN